MTSIMKWAGDYQLFVVFSLVLIISIILYVTRAIPIFTRLAQLSTFLAPVFLIGVLVYAPIILLVFPVASLFPLPFAGFIYTIALISCAIICAWWLARAVGVFDRSRWLSELRVWIAVFFSGIGHLGPIFYILQEISSSQAGRPNRGALLIGTIMAYGLSFLLTIRFRREAVNAESLH